MNLRELLSELSVTCYWLLVIGYRLLGKFEHRNLIAETRKPQSVFHADWRRSKQISQINSFPHFQIPKLPITQYLSHQLIRISSPRDCVEILTPYNQLTPAMMKTIATIVLLSLSLFSHAQEASVEKTVFGIQTGLLGVWIHNESRLTDKLALRTEIGLDGGFWAGYFYDEVGYMMAPVLTAEPRYYYNLAKRQLKTKDIRKNSGNFISVKTSFHPDWFVISNEKDLYVISDLSLVPTWGLRRNLGTHFNFEAGAGLGVRFYFGEFEDTELAANLHLRIGYVF